jgi:ribonuclease BN (tRNA processing enzyme)
MDHIAGFPFFKPIYDEKTMIHLKGCPSAQGNIRKLLSRSMQAPFFPVPFDKLKANVDFEPECHVSLQVGTMEVEFITLSHPNLGTGYRFTENGRRFVFLTDNELGHRHRGGRSFKEYASFARGADLLFHDAEYTPEQYLLTKSWGHSTYTEALELALAAGVKNFGLFHHNQDRTDRELNRVVRRCRKWIQDRGAHTSCFAVSDSFEEVL